MTSRRSLIQYIGAILLTLITLWWGFNYFSADILNFFKTESTFVISFTEISVEVSVADEEAEWQQGLSGVVALEEGEGKLFIFPETGNYGMWMKDMLIPIDIIWLDDTFTIVHIERDVSPDTYPQSFRSPVPARFVLETNADFAKAFNLQVGSKARFPTYIIPRDLQI